MIILIMSINHLCSREEALEEQDTQQAMILIIPNIIEPEGLLTIRTWRALIILFIIQEYQVRAAVTVITEEIVIAVIAVIIYQR
jgi:hypothetical protein